MDDIAVPLQQPDGRILGGIHIDEADVSNLIVVNSEPMSQEFPRRQKTPIRRQGPGMEFPLVSRAHLPAQGAQQLPGGDIPDADGLVVGHRDQFLAIRGEQDVPYQGLVAAGVDDQLRHRASDFGRGQRGMGMRITALSSWIPPDRLICRFPTHPHK
uniref:Uncharacterized protein n=1 Tax=Candidatus Kentrum sp. LFY TaxID=2126342 RepID=A0A450WXV6_9GAMM|nr:MAG: hypothetical protein BECKLFY1418C_GA0070996_110413 [Candidatus Kentron sp. LFY]